MTTLPVIPDLDVFEYLLTGHLARGEAAPVHQLLLQRSKETLHRRIVPAVAPAAHAARDPGLAQNGLVIAAGILAASVTVAD